MHVTYRSVKPAAFFPRVILIGCNNLVLSNAFPLTAASCLKCCTAALGPHCAERSDMPWQCRKRAIAVPASKSRTVWLAWEVRFKRRRHCLDCSRRILRYITVITILALTCKLNFFFSRSKATPTTKGSRPQPDSRATLEYTPFGGIWEVSLVPRPSCRSVFAVSSFW